MAAAFVDAAAGGGGLVQVPALLILFPAVPYPMLAGTNKIASGCGTLVALGKFRTAIKIPRSALFLVPLTFAGSYAGACLVSSINQRMVRPGVAIILAGVWLLASIRKAPNPDLDKEELPYRLNGWIPLALALTIGFYDGLIGPGTGLFLIYGFVYWIGVTYLQASALAKLLNLTSNVAAIIYFSFHGSFLPLLLPYMIPAQVLGGYLGAKAAVKWGSKFIRSISLWVTALLVLKLVWDVALGR